MTKRLKGTKLWAGKRVLPVAKYFKQGTPKLVMLRDEEHYSRMGQSVASRFPTLKGQREWMASEENRGLLEEIISAGRRAFMMQPVKSNQELIDRIDEYFAIVQGRRCPPTIEEFSLYLGYTSETIGKMRAGINYGFADRPLGPGVDTSEILKRAFDVMHAADAVQAMKRLTDNTTYIFRSKNYYDMKDSREQAINVNIKTPDALPPEEIAKLLPDFLPDRSMDDVEVI